MASHLLLLLLMQIEHPREHRRRDLLRRLSLLDTPQGAMDTHARIAFDLEREIIYNFHNIVIPMLSSTARSCFSNGRGLGPTNFQIFSLK